MANKGGIITGVITLVIGGTVFSLSKADIAKNFSKDTGMSQQQAEQYVENINKDDLVSYDKLGSDMSSDGQDILDLSSKLDCENYTYDWEIVSLSCKEGRSQLVKLGNDEISLGKAYIALASDSASENDMSLAINLIDKVNSDLDLEIIDQLLDRSAIDETKKTNSYNKALLQTALDSQ
ncbi:MAG: hypothetical protein WC220_00025 [Pedobacter sp.]|jgi:hypothetical protein